MHYALSRTRHVAPAAIVPLAVTLTAVTMAACGSSPTGPGNAGRNAGPPQVATVPPMNGTGPMTAGNGLSATADGYRMTSPLTTLPAAVPAAYTFTITAPDGTPLTRYATDHTKELHFYAIRSDLTGYQHIHPVMAPDGTWTAPLAGLEPGHWTLYASFIPASGHASGTEFILSRTVTVPGSYAAAPLPTPAAVTTTDDGYRITAAGDLVPGMATPLTITIARYGEPVTTLEPYLGAYAHLTAIHAGDLAFAHLHPQGATHGDNGGPALTFNAYLPETGPWRLFLQFQTNGHIHTTHITLNP